jgi:hypothetical protein
LNHRLLAIAKYSLFAELEVTINITTTFPDRGAARGCVEHIHSYPDVSGWSSLHDLDVAKLQGSELGQNLQHLRAVVVREYSPSDLPQANSLDKTTLCTAIEYLAGLVAGLPSLRTVTLVITPSACLQFPNLAKPEVHARSQETLARRLSRLCKRKIEVTLTIGGFELLFSELLAEGPS